MIDAAELEIGRSAYEQQIEVRLVVFETGVLPRGHFLPGQTVLQCANQLGHVLEPMAQRVLTSIATRSC